MGQGDATFIESPTGNQLLIDGGAGPAVLRELGRVMPVHDRSIDVVIATHPDQDHIGGLAAVIERYDVDLILRSGAVNDTAAFRALNDAASRETAAQAALARRGMRLDLGGGLPAAPGRAAQAGAYLDILFPDRDVSGVEPNAASVIARLVYGESEFLLTGDAPKSIEEYLVTLDGSALKSDVLKVGHHGSKTSSSQNFVGFVSPGHAVISAGCDNRYGHPHREVLEIFARFDIETINTCNEGTIIFETDGKTLLRR